MDAPTLSEPTSPETARIDALITLLADEDPKVGEAIAGHLLDIGTPALPALKAAARGTVPTLAARARTLAAELEARAVVEGVAAFAASGARNLEEGLILLARLDRPDLDPAEVSAEVSRMAEDLMIRLDPGDGPDRMLSALSRYLHEEQGFAGNSADYYNPANAYLHTVLETRRGIPISLSALYLVLTRRLGLPLFGVGMPGHFLIKYDDGRQSRVLDPFHRGRMLDREGCAKLLRGLGLSFDERYLAAVDTRYLMERTLKNLIAVFADRKLERELDLHQRALDALRGK